MVCFGATPAVKTRVEKCVENGFWADIPTEPLALFDLVLDGLFASLDKTVWDLLNVIRKLETVSPSTLRLCSKIRDNQVLTGCVCEQDVLDAARDKGRKPVTTQQINFPELHNWAKHLIELHEVMESSLQVVDGTLSCVGKSRTGPHYPNNTHSATNMTVQDQLRQSLDYRRSLFMSTKLRLQSMEKRVSNTITLAFNVVTQQDSRLMRQDSASMTIISYMTLLFLPTAGVATIVGSQLFDTNFDPEVGTPSVTYTSPLFWLMWWIAIPLTFVTMLVAVVYRRFVAASSSVSKDSNAYPKRGGGGGSVWGSGEGVRVDGSWAWGRKLERQPVQSAPPPGQPAIRTGGNVHMNPSQLNSQQSTGLVSV